MTLVRLLIYLSIIYTMIKLIVFFLEEEEARAVSDYEDVVYEKMARRLKYYCHVKEARSFYSEWNFTVQKYTRVRDAIYPEDLPLFERYAAIMDSYGATLKKVEKKR